MKTSSKKCRGRHRTFGFIVLFFISTMLFAQSVSGQIVVKVKVTDDLFFGVQLDPCAANGSL